MFLWPLEQAARLLSALNIDPASLPPPSLPSERAADWQQVWSSGTVHLPAPSAATDSVLGAQAAWDDLWEDRVKREEEDRARYR